MRRFLSITFIFLLYCQLHAQFKGMDSFRWNPLWQKILRQAGVKRVSEFTAYNGNKEYNTGRCLFDKEGRVTELFLPYEESYKRCSFTYDRKNQVIQVINYNHKDTTKIISREDRRFDKSGKMIGAVTNNFVEGKWIQDISETKILSKSKTVTVKETIYKKAGIIYMTIYERDSLDGLCSFVTKTTIENIAANQTDSLNGAEKNEMIEAEVEIQSAKNYLYRKVERFCAEKNIKYTDEINSLTVGGEESIYKIKTNYVKYDDKNRFIELGEINYSEFPRHAGISHVGISKDLINKVLNGTIKGREQMNLQFTYKDDLLVEENIVGAKKQYIYNQQGQLIKSVELQGNKDVSIYKYNEKGLITEINTTGTYTKTVKYQYGYY